MQSDSMGGILTVSESFTVGVSVRGALVQCEVSSVLTVEANKGALGWPQLPFEFIGLKKVGYNCLTAFFYYYCAKVFC